MNLTPDDTLFGKTIDAALTGFHLNDTIVFTWGVMAFLVLGSILITRKLSTTGPMSRWQNLLEIIVGGARSQIEEMSGQDARPYLPFIGTLFIFIVTCNLLIIVPGFKSPTASLSTTAALAICVFVAVPIYGIAKKGLGGYLKNYLQPSPFMLPFNVIGELSRTLALAVRLFGNMMSGVKIGAILLAVTPLFIPVVMQVLGLLTGVIQAYIFAILAMVYISSGTKAQQPAEKAAPDETGAAPASSAQQT